MLSSTGSRVAWTHSTHFLPHRKKPDCKAFTFFKLPRTASYFTHHKLFSRLLSFSFSPAWRISFLWGGLTNLGQEYGCYSTWPLLWLHLSLVRWKKAKNAFHLVACHTMSTILHLVIDGGTRGGKTRSTLFADDGVSQMHCQIVLFLWRNCWPCQIKCVRLLEIWNGLFWSKRTLGVKFQCDMNFHVLRGFVQMLKGSFVCVTSNVSKQCISNPPFSPFQCWSSF